MVEMTIIMPCFNKEAYIAQALDSVFAQKVDFSFRIVIADDGSTDRTLAVVGDYAARHPDVFEVLTSERNQGLFANVRRAYAICKTPYFCVLDPDDFWTDECHLQKAVDFLSRHRKFTIYCAGTEMLRPDGSRERCREFPARAVDSDFHGFLRQDAVIAYTQTCVYRNVVFVNGLPEKVENPPFPSMYKSFRGDSFRNFIHLQRGKVHFSPEVEACYRQTGEGVFQSLDRVSRFQLNARVLLDFWRYDDGKYPQLLTQSRRLFDRALDAFFSEQGTLSPASGRLVEEMKELLEAYTRNRWEVDRGAAELLLAGGYLGQRTKTLLRCFAKRLLGKGA